MTTRANSWCIGAIAFVISNVVAPSISDRDRAELHGPVKSVSVRWQANHKDDYGSIEERELGVKTYNEAGELVEDREITPDFIRARKPERHGANETVFRAVMGSALERYEFDAKGNLVVRRIWYGDTAKGDASMTERFKYDGNGRTLQRDSYGPDGKAFNTTLYTRDSTGDIVVEETRSDKLSAPYPRMHYTYVRDSHGNWTSRIVVRENVPENSYEYRYAGNLYRTIVYFGDAK